MKFIDEATIIVRSGNGGKGCVSFRREKFVPRGGPDGGDGGRGGDVVLQASPRKRTLYDFRFKRQFKAANGGHGQSARKTGKDGQALVIEVPYGTQVIDAVSGRLLGDLTTPGQSIRLAQGGRGGRGNARFKTATHQAPRFAQPGEEGQQLTIKLELKLIADVGLIGLPNAGKSTLISRMSAARPKVGNYPFTTTSPNLGVVKTGRSQPFVVADIPGLIEGAHRGAGLGIRFLRHIERTRLLVHLIDVTDVSPDHPLKAYQAVIDELTRYNPSLLRKPQLVVLNKMDLPDTVDKAKMFSDACRADDILRVSSITGDGVSSLISKIIRKLDGINE